MHVVREHKTKDVQGQGPSKKNHGLFASLMFTGRALQQLPYINYNQAKSNSSITFCLCSFKTSFRVK